MDEISDGQKLQWLTTTVATRKRAVIIKDNLQVPNYENLQLRRWIPQPSIGNLDILPPELLPVVFQHLTCDDLEALGSCSTGGRIAILAFPQYRDLLKHAPCIFAILKETQLARSFTIAKIYETFVSPLCTNCGQFGGYVFLPSFARCCIYCAEFNWKFLPIGRKAAKKQFGVTDESILETKLPQFKSIQGFYSTRDGEIRQVAPRRSTLFSRELVERSKDPKHTLAFARHDQTHDQTHGNQFIKGHQRYMALTALACFIPKSASMEKGVYCAGCVTRAREHHYCTGKDSREFDPRIRAPTTTDFITDGRAARCWPKGYWDQCLLVTERDRLHDSRNILSHLQDCEAAQALLKMKWTQYQKDPVGHHGMVPVKGSTE